jgi:hypothetical protein
MPKSRALIALLTAVALVAAPMAARAEEVAGPLEPGAEKTAAACSDHADNDDDGKTDCADPDCQNFSFCSAATLSRTYWLAPLVAGAVLIPVAIGIALGSIPLWADAIDWGHPPLNQHFSGQDGLDLMGAAILTAAGLGLAIGGTVLLVRGIVRHRQWKSSRAFVPTIAVSGDRTSFGIGGTF